MRDSSQEPSMTLEEALRFAEERPKWVGNSPEGWQAAFVAGAKWWWGRGRQPPQEVIEAMTAEALTRFPFGRPREDSYMNYDYAIQRNNLFTDVGQGMFLRVRDAVHRHCAMAGAVRMDKAMEAAGSGDSWDMLACVDRLVEIGELREITGPNVAGQDRVFVRTTR